MKLKDIVVRVRALAALILTRRPAVASGPPSAAAAPPAAAPATLATESRASADGPHAGGPLAAAPDPELDALLRRAARLEAQQAEFAARLADMEARVNDFAYRQYRALGELLGECLRLRRNYLRLLAARSNADADRERARAAEAEFEAYRRTAAAAAVAPPELDEAGQDELRRLYRAAVMRCHPDRVGEAERPEANAAFLRVQAAYRAHDLTALRRVLAELDAQPAPRAEAPGAAGAGDRLRQRVSGLQIDVADLILAIQTLQLSDRYREVLRAGEDDTEFRLARQSFEAECAQLRAQIAALGGSAD